MTTGRINQVAFLRDVRLAWSSTHYIGRGEAIMRREHRSCQGTKCTSYERTGPRPYAHEIFRIRKHDRASMHRRSQIMSIDTLGTPGTTEVHQAATRSLDGQGMAIHPKFHRFRWGRKKVKGKQSGTGVGWVAQQQYRLRHDQVRCTDIGWSTLTPNIVATQGLPVLGVTMSRQVAQSQRERATT
ncbi:hypothetical protein V6N13_057283 [Hibiscus sabdariffa]